MSHSLGIIENDREVTPAGAEQTGEQCSDRCEKMCDDCRRIFEAFLAQRDALVWAASRTGTRRTF